jgi:hypothetical protein
MRACVCFILYIRLVGVVCVEVELRTGKIYDVVFIARANGLGIYMSTSSFLSVSLSLSFSLDLTVNNTDGGGSGEVGWTDATCIW